MIVLFNRLKEGNESSYDDEDRYLLESLRPVLSIAVENGVLIEQQREYFERERFAAIGKMARESAHELNNPIAAADTIAHILERKLTTDPQAREEIHQIRSNLNRCRDV